MYDNYSTDNSVDLARSLGMEVRTFGKQGELNDAEYIRVKDNCWKEARGEADFVIVCDADEFLYHKDLLRKLQEYKENGITLPRTKGYEMVSEILPSQDIFDITTGFKQSKFSKSLIFDPNKIEEINYNYGSHNHKARGLIKKSWSRLWVLHYRNIGGFERIRKRHEEYQNRLSQFNKDMRFGKEYLMDLDEKYSVWKTMIRKSKEILR